jgi:hypothetical protein
MNEIEAKIQEDSLALCEETDSFRIRTKADYERAGEYLVSLRLLKKEIKEFFKPMKQKIDAAKREVLDKEKSQLEPLAERESAITAKIGTYRKALARKEELKRQKLLEKVREEREKAAEEGLPEPELPVVSEAKSAPKVDGLGFRKSFTWDVADISKINRKYLVPDKKAISKIVKSVGKDAESIIGGITVSESESAVVRS